LILPCGFGLVACVTPACDVLFLREHPYVPPDGVPADRAPCMPMTMRDEDMDGMPDDCDPCPGDSGGFVDSDDDGVGDACDPAPMERCEVRRMFDGFGSPSNVPIKTLRARRASPRPSRGPWAARPSAEPVRAANPARQRARGRVGVPSYE